MTHFPLLERPDAIARAINSRYLTEEQELVRDLADRARLGETAVRAVGASSLALVQEGSPHPARRAFHGPSTR